VASTPGDRVRRMVVGLGNPGAEYLGTRHNVGFDVLDRIASEARVATAEGLIFGECADLEGFSGNRSFRCAWWPEAGALLVKPETFMNQSGAVVEPLARWAGIGPEDILVVYDDMDLDVAQLRIRPFGGAGGHNGVRSLIESLGNDRFPRMRIGVGRPGTDAARHVLTGFSPEERAEIDVSVAEAAEAASAWLEDGDIEGCMTRFHSRWNQGDRDDPAAHHERKEDKRHD